MTVRPTTAPTPVPVRLTLGGAALGAYDSYHVRRAGDIKTAASYGLGAAPQKSVKAQPRGGRGV